MEDNRFSNISNKLKTPSPPAKMRLLFETLDNLERKRSTSGSQTSNSELSLNADLPLINNYGLNYLNSNQNNQNSQNHHPQPNHVNNQADVPESTESLNNNSIQYGLKTEDYDNKVPIKPLSTESQRASFTCKSRLGNTGDALTGIVKKYRELQAKSKVSLVLDDSSDEEESNNEQGDLSDTPSFRCTSDEDELSSSPPCINSLESPRQNNKKLMNKQPVKSSRQYRSDPQLSSYEDSGDQSSNGGGGMYQDSIRYHSQTLKKSAKVFDTVTVCNVEYFILNEIGEGGSSKVYQICDHQKNEFYALKVVDMTKMADNLKSSLMKEIDILKMLKGCKRVIQLYAHEMRDGKMMLVMEKGDSDLSTVLGKMVQNDFAANKRRGLDLHTIKHYWNEMLKAVDEIHKKNVIHSDLKPVNFVIVKGYLKIIDFGIADAINPDHTSVIKTNLVGTINFMSPESLVSKSSAKGDKEIKVNCKSDVWSLGCILYNMIYGRTPFGNIENIYEKIAAIGQSNIKYPPYEDLNAIDCIKKCLARDPKCRPDVAQLFDHPFLNNSKDKLKGVASKLQIQQPRPPLSARTPVIKKRIFDDFGPEVDKLTPRTYAKFANVMKQELIKIKK